MAGDREKAMSAGFTDYLVKPVVPEQIAAVLWRYVNAESSRNPSSS
jgi:CheY-like chemotaxis protein